MKKICIIVCHFGPTPPWMPVFLESVRRNPTVDWLFFGDLDVAAPSNCSFHVMRLDQLAALIAERLALPVRVESPYKLCDYRPAFGVIFNEYLGEYDFWGHGDLDVVYGDVREFLTDELLDSNDIVATREEYLTGHLTLYRNDEAINSLYRESPDHERIFRDPRHYCFDECNFRWKKLLFDGVSIFDTRSEIASMTHVVKRLAEQGAVRAHFETIVSEVIDYRRQEFRLHWDRGRLSDVASGRSYIHFHIGVYKRDPRFFVPRWTVVPESFYVSRKGFRSERELASVTRRTLLLVRELALTPRIVAGKLRSCLRAW